MKKTQTVLMLILALTVPSLAAQEAGNTITFALPEGTEVTILGSDDPGDKLIFVGRSSETTDGGTCANGTAFHIQSIVIVDPRPRGTRATRRQVITTSQSTHVPPGTRVTRLSAGSQCDIAGVVYDTYTGTVE